MPTFKIFGQRHGDKGPKPEERLTEKGHKQVCASAAAHLRGRSFVALLHSGMTRAREAVADVVETLSLPSSLPIIQDGDFSPLQATEAPHNRGLHPIAAADAAVKAAMKERGMEETAALWLEFWPPARELAGQVRVAIRHRALELAKLYPEGGANLFVASHSPTIELGAPDLTRIPRLREADIIVYTVEVEDGSATIKDVEVLHAPAVS